MPLLLLPLVLLGLLILLVEARVLTYAYRKVGVHPRYAFAVMLLSLLGSQVNIPLYSIDRGATVVALNVGGALIPILVSFYLLVHTGMYRRMVVRGDAGARLSGCGSLGRLDGDRTTHLNALSRLPAAAGEDQDTGRTGPVDEEIAHAAGARGDHRLVRLVDERAAKTDGQRDPGGGPRRSPGPPQERPEPEQREDGVLGEVRELPQHHVNRVELRAGRAGRQRFQEGHDERPGVGSREVRGAQNEHERQPEQRQRVPARGHCLPGYAA